jgi:hypothetical protein
MDQDYEGDEDRHEDDDVEDLDGDEEDDEVVEEGQSLVDDIVQQKEDTSNNYTQNNAKRITAHESNYKGKNKQKYTGKRYGGIIYKKHFRKSINCEESMDQGGDEEGDHYQEKDQGPADDRSINYAGCFNSTGSIFNEGTADDILSNNKDDDVEDVEIIASGSILKDKWSRHIKRFFEKQKQELLVCSLEDILILSENVKLHLLSHFESKSSFL